MDRPQAAVSVVMMLTFLLVGLPIWWNTTNVYRATLPKENITTLQTWPIKLKAVLDIQSSFHSDTDLENIKRSLDARNVDQVAQYDISWKIVVQHVAMEMDGNFKSHCAIWKGDNGLKYRFLIFQNASFSKPFNYLCEKTLTSIVVLPKPYFIEELVEWFVTLQTSLLPRVGDDFGNRKFNKHSLPPAPGFQITFTLAIADPSDYSPSWDIQTAIQCHLDPFLNAYSFLGPFKVFSQVLYYTDVNIEPYKDDQLFYYTRSRLALLINPMESRLTSHTNTEPSLNFVVYVPSRKFSPLFIRRKKSYVNDKFTSFHSPRWGGVVFYSPTNDTAVPIGDIMPIFVEQLRILIGAHDCASNGELETLRGFSVCEWSRSKLLVAKTFENLKTSLSTLVSLTKLLDEIANIVIRDEIKELIDNSVSKIEVGITYLSKGDIESAFLHSKDAFMFSERAFYDPSLFALLYFPDDQKYAIYVPLFLPISLPIVLSFAKAVKFLKGDV